MDQAYLAEELQIKGHSGTPADGFQVPDTNLKIYNINTVSNCETNKNEVMGDDEKPVNINEVFDSET